MVKPLNKNISNENELKIILLIKMIKIWITYNINNNNILYNLTFVIVKFPNLKSQILKFKKKILYGNNVNSKSKSKQ